MLGFPSVNFNNRKNRANEFDSILPLSNKSSRNEKSLLDYIYDASSSVSSTLFSSCQAGVCYLTDFAGSIVKLSRSKSGFLPKTQQDLMHRERAMNLFDIPKTPITNPIQAENEGSFLVKPIVYELRIKTPSPFKNY